MNMLSMFIIILPLFVMTAITYGIVKALIAWSVAIIYTFVVIYILID